jgi:hypothetical protein
MRRNGESAAAPRAPIDVAKSMRLEDVALHTGKLPSYPRVWHRGARPRVGAGSAFARLGRVEGNRENRTVWPRDEEYEAWKERWAPS